MDNDQIALTWLVSIIGALAAAVLALFLWIVKSSEKKVHARLDQENEMNKTRIAASDESFQKGIREAHSNNIKLADRLEATITEMHRDQETSRKNCQDLVSAITKQIADKELMALKTFAEKTEVNALRIEHGRTLERIHDKLDKLSEKLSGS